MGLVCRFPKGLTMPTFHMELPHRCSRQSAQTCVDKSLGDLKVRYAAYISATSIAWQGEAADFTIQLVAPAKVDIKGRVNVSPAVVTLDGEFTLPAMFRVFPVGPMVENSIRKAWGEQCAKCPVEK